MKPAAGDLSDALKMGGQCAFESSSGFVLIRLALMSDNLPLVCRPYFLER
jgi:hypothetical protein